MGVCDRRVLIAVATFSSQAERHYYPPNPIRLVLAFDERSEDRGLA